MPINIDSDRDDQRIVTTHEAGALAQLRQQIEAREHVHALGGPDGDIVDAPWHREEQP